MSQEALWETETSLLSEVRSCTESRVIAKAAAGSDEDVDHCPDGQPNTGEESKGPVRWVIRTFTRHFLPDGSVAPGFLPYMLLSNCAVATL